jgi:predicted TPR repeat methyltransferase
LEKATEFNPYDAAENYDREAEATNWLGPEVAFGLSFKFIKSGESILDIGIGTGLSSALYHKAGLNVFGMDISPEMLEVCAEKKIAVRLERHDLTKTPYPFDTASMDHVTCVGVMHFFRDLSLIFKEASRIIRQNGIFIFVVADKKPEQDSEIKIMHSDFGITIYRHSLSQIGNLVKNHKFLIVRSQEFPVSLDHEHNIKIEARAYTVRKT